MVGRVRAPINRGKLSFHVGGEGHCLHGIIASRPCAEHARNQISRVIGQI